MDYLELVNSRRSIRGYKTDPIPKETIDAVIAEAKRAPSSMNVQAWHVHVLTGAALDEIRRRNMEELLEGLPPQREILTHGPYKGLHRKRQIDIAKKLFAAMEIGWDDKERRGDWAKRGFRQFDAPVSIILTYDRSLDPGATCHFDLGALSYGIVLSAWNKGLGCVVNGQGISRSHIVREVANIPEDEVIMTAIAMGYPDDDFPANSVVSDREPNDHFVRYVGFN